MSKLGVLSSYSDEHLVLAKCSDCSIGYFSYQYVIDEYVLASVCEISARRLRRLAVLRQKKARKACRKEKLKSNNKSQKAKKSCSREAKKQVGVEEKQQ